MKKIIWMLTCVAIGLSGCGIADISQSYTLPLNQSKQIAAQKIEEVIQAQGFDIMQHHNLYSLEVTDHWRGFLGKIAKLWPEPKTTFSFKYNFNTFDGSATFLTGKKEGNIIGVQSWEFYEKDKGGEDFVNKDTGDKHNPMEFGIVVLHYFIELPYRLRNAPIKRYYGQKMHNGNQYDLVFASWKSEAPNKEYDQYILWINMETKLVDYCIYTLRSNTNPFTRHKYGSIAYMDYKDIDGFKLATQMPIMLDDGVVTAASLDEYFHRFSIHDFSFGDFEESVLYPLPGLEKKMDYKEK
ncbi:MAG: hypothetical protein MI974_21815 [Chitinophagales bacterium]|nr:hypothetical protein [Chitinophagales bacterium]